jgi:hypothetical protein
MVRMEYNQSNIEAQGLPLPPNKIACDFDNMRFYSPFWLACFRAKPFSFLASGTHKFKILLNNQSKIVNFGRLLLHAGVYNNVKNNVDRRSPFRGNSGSSACRE